MTAFDRYTNTRIGIRHSRAKLTTEPALQQAYAQSGPATDSARPSTYPISRARIPDRLARLFDSLPRPILLAYADDGECLPSIRSAGAARPWSILADQCATLLRSLDDRAEVVLAMAQGEA